MSGRITCGPRPGRGCNVPHAASDRRLRADIETSDRWVADDSSRDCHVLDHPVAERAYVGHLGVSRLWDGLQPHDPWQTGDHAPHRRRHLITKAV
jgi:hypothetical protein